ncbi:MAG: rhodanese-related sulfurtransferase [Aeoliella sp.]
MKIVNAAAYKFVPLQNLPDRRVALKALCDGAGLRGTILLASEGINLFVAGDRKGVDLLLDSLQADVSIGPLDIKESCADEQPYNRMLVKIKKEIIAFGVEGIEPGELTSKRIAPRELRQWLDEGRDVTLLDTRNDYEIDLGSFSGAERLGIDHFRHFPRAAEQLPDAWRDRPLVMFCTGGIRCEKAGPLLEQLGFEQVFQLDGGILRYFEEVGQAHYEGDCFVFDKRVAVDAALNETDAALCFACQRVLSAEEQRSPQYVVGKSCPHCYAPGANGAT